MRTTTKIFLLFLVAMMLMSPAMASNTEVVWGESCSLPLEEMELPEGLKGVMLTEVPTESMGILTLGHRQLKAGDALSGEDLKNITFIPSGQLVGDATISCISLTESGLGENAEAVISIGDGKNGAPIAEDSQFTTYKNIPTEVMLKTSDPEGDPLMVTIVKDPKRGTVEVSDEGIVTYTPKENKVGKDSFTYYVTDPSGNASEEATVRLEIKKPEHKETYADMADDPGLIAATWLREEKIFTPESIENKLLFQPEKTVTRGEFIAMCSALTGINEEEALVEVSFTDQVPQWLTGAVSTAVQCGYLTGIPTENGMSLCADATISQGEAATMIRDMLNLPKAEAQTVMADSEADWAAEAVMAVSTAGILEITDSSAPLTRRDAAKMLYQAGMMGEEAENTLLSWAKD